MLLFTTPDTLEIGSAEVYPLAVDFTALLTGSERTDAPTATLVDLADGTAYAAGILSSPAPVSDGAHLVNLVLTSLQAGHRYRLTVTCTPTASSHKTVEAAVTIICPF